MEPHYGCQSLESVPRIASLRIGDYLAGGVELVNPADRQRIEAQLHADPAKAENLEYVRLYTGFSRRITVTPGDIARLTGT